MYQIGVDDYVILFVEYRDHFSRWAVPAHYTVDMLATRVADMTDAEHKDRRKGDTELLVFVSQEYTSRLDPRGGVSFVFKDDDRVRIVRRDKVR